MANRKEKKEEEIFQEALKDRAKAKKIEIEQTEERSDLQVRRQARKSKRELSLYKKREKEYQQEIDRLEEMVAIAADLNRDTEKYNRIKIKTREKGAVREGTAVLLYSDIHPEEVITPDTVSGLNEFNPEIARERILKLIEGTRWTLETARASHGRAGYKIRDFVLALLGDLISNTIHPDLAESVAMGPADAVNFVMDLIQMVIDALLEDKHLETIYVPACLGNHDRMTPKNRHQTKAQNSLATIVYAFLRRLYRDEPRVQFDIARGNMVYSEIYGKTIRWTHGDDIRYNGGVGGLTIPMNKAIDAWNKSIYAHLTCSGHFHTILNMTNCVVNGSIIGYSAFAQAIKAVFEPAAQAMFILDPERGKRFFTPVQVQECEHWS